MTDRLEVRGAVLEVQRGWGWRWEGWEWRFRGGWGWRHQQRSMQYFCLVDLLSWKF